MRNYLVLYNNFGLVSKVSRRYSLAIQNTGKCRFRPSYDCADALVTDNHEFQDAFCSTPDAVAAMVAMYDGCTSRSLLLALTRAVCSVTRGNPVAQKMFVAAGVTDYISALMTLKVFRQPVSSSRTQTERRRSFK